MNETREGKSTYVFNNADKTNDSALLNMVVFGSQNMCCGHQHVQIKKVCEGSFPTWYLYEKKIIKMTIIKSSWNNEFTRIEK